MSARTRQAVGYSLGLISVVLLIAGNEVGKIGGGSPPLHASPAVYLDAVASSGAALIGGFLVIVAWLAFAGFFAVAVGSMERAGQVEVSGRLILGGAVLTAAIGIAGAPPLAAAGVLAADGDLSPQIAKALVLLNAVTFVLTWLTAAVPMGLSAARLGRVRMLPRVLSWSGLVLAPMLAAGSLAVWRYEAAFLAWMLTMIWIAAASITLTWRATRGHTSPVARDRTAAKTAVHATS